MSSLIMEPDSTTSELNFPFAVHPDNLKLFLELTSGNGQVGFEVQMVQSLQALGLIPKTMRCVSNSYYCNMKVKNSRVTDRVQWVCRCLRRITVRSGSVFKDLQCSILQVLQLVLAWCEDADCAVVAEHFGVTPRVASGVYDKLDALAAPAQRRLRLGGDGCVVIAELFPHCSSRLSPDTTAAEHTHQVLMLAETRHIPTRYCLHVIKEDENAKNASAAQKYQALSQQVSSVISTSVVPNSTVVAGRYVPPVDGALSLATFLHSCDPGMQRFLCERIWSQADVLCNAAYELCTPGPSGAGCHAAVQRYLDTSLYRLRHGGDDFYRHMLALLADQFTVAA